MTVETQGLGALMYIIMEEYPQKCSEIRRDKGLTQKQIADEIGMSQQNISRFESGKNNSFEIALFYYIKFYDEIHKWYLDEMVY